MEQRIYMFDSPKLIAEMLDTICEDCISDSSTEILEVSRPDGGEYEATGDPKDPFHRMMMDKMEYESRNRRNMLPSRIEDELNEYQKKRYSKCYVLIIKNEDEFDFSALDDIAWMNGGLVSEQSASFFYKKAKKAITLAPDYSLINQVFGSEEDYSSVYDDRFGR
ncbi:hypothetical protein OAO35_00310 [Euryarchaeota archaeon]|jgi:hypothetical protein|nr:hypothetical protein [Euryarchaeota archaeon]